MPKTLSTSLRAALEARGITRLYTHQSCALDWVSAGRDVIIATPTASGKSLCYHLPVLNAFAQNPDARALYLFPTKALARDQEEGLRRLMADAALTHGAITYDGDTPGDARRVARQRAGVLMTNPDMLHAGILPHHTGWARFFANLKYVVIDELHMYRGVFGSHLSNVVRRLQRIARFHGSEPVFIMASATIGNPGEHAERIIGRPVACLGDSGAPVGPRDVLVYNPPIVNEELGLRANYQKTAVRLTADLVRAGIPTLVFGHSRTGVEVMLKYLREALADHPIEDDAIMAYRGGYLPERRRRIESDLRAGHIRCVVATNALELGIDIGTLDAVVCAGYPGSIAALWQRFGRAGRRMSGSLALLVTSSMPLDQFFAHQPTAIVETPIEQARIDPDNLEILIQHVKCAAFELPFEAGETLGAVPWATVEEALDFLAHHRVVHRVESGQGLTYHWASDVYPASDVSLRSVGWDNFVIIDVEASRTLAEMDWRSAHTMLHEQAIYQHDASQYQVETLDYENRKAFVRLVKPDYYTTAETHTTIDVVKEDEHALTQHTDAWAVPFGLGEVSIVDKVVGFKKIRFHTHENVGFGEVHLPAMQMHTSAFWMTIPEAFVIRRPEERSTIVDALRGFAKAIHMVAAASLMIDPRDLGRTLGDRDAPNGPLGTTKGTGFDPTIFIYDAIPGGIGLATRLYDDRRALIHRALKAIQRCPCSRGCPSCIGPVDLGGHSAGKSAQMSANRKMLIIDLMKALGFVVEMA
ncbi:MAG: DEAD/DEAH box helicase [Myxococcota bacterium]|nr:DEAD/DEAH box helicase [Myxococcota bacterium]